MRYAINSKKIKKDLKWKPNTNFVDGLKKTFDWYNCNQSYYSSLNKKDFIKRLGSKK